MGHVALLLRFKPKPGAASSLRRWLLQNVLPQLPRKPGVGSVHLLEGAVTPQMTNEQRIRGADASVDWALLLTAYDQDAVEKQARQVLGARNLEYGAAGVLSATYRIDYSLTHGEVDA